MDGWRGCSYLFRRRFLPPPLYTASPSHTLRHCSHLWRKKGGIFFVDVGEGHSIGGKVFHSESSFVSVSVCVWEREKDPWAMEVSEEFWECAYFCKMSQTEYNLQFLPLDTKFMLIALQLRIQNWYIIQVASTKFAAKTDVFFLLQVWYCTSSRSHTTISKYAEILATSFKGEWLIFDKILVKLIIRITWTHLTSIIKFIWNLSSRSQRKTRRWLLRKS